MWRTHQQRMSLRLARRVPRQRGVPANANGQLLENGAYALSGAAFGGHRTGEQTFAWTVIERLPADALCQRWTQMLSFVVTFANT